jgi:Phage integrase family
MIPTNDPAAIKGDDRAAGRPAAAPATLETVLDALEGRRDLAPNRLRDLRSAVTRVAKLLGAAPSHIPLDLPVLSGKLAAINPAAAGLSTKTFSNIRSDFLAAISASGLKQLRSPGKGALSPGWARLLAKLPKRRAGIGLSRLARHASREGVEPDQIDDAALDRFITAVRQSSLHRNPNRLHRTIAKIWNEAARQPGLDLRQVTIPSFRPPAKRTNWEDLMCEFRQHVDAHLAWCAGSDMFHADARPRPLAAQTLKLRRIQIHAAVTALVAAGVNPSAIKSLADLVSPDAFKLILRQRYNAANGRENSFNRGLAETLAQIAREWVKVDAGVLAELKKLVGKMPMPQPGLTDKNKGFLRQFDDPAVLQRLHDLPDRLWAEVRRQPPHFRTLAKAQAALALNILCYIPLRLQNLVPLTFDVHLFVRAEANAISSLEIAAPEVKNKTDMAFDIPRRTAKMLIEYRDRIAPKIIGRRPDRLFVNADGSPKSPSTVAWLIKTYARRRAGIVLTSHQFRHLSAKVLLDAEPGSFETVRQLLGHKSLKTTVGAYAGIDSRRAARHHQHLIEQALATRPARHRLKAKPVNAER